MGVKNPAVESYLENGNEGEIFVRSPTIFSKYMMTPWIQFCPESCLIVKN